MIIKILKYISIVFIAVLLGVAGWLITGINYKNISYNNILIKHLYIKYDKGLHIYVKKLSIKDRTSNKSTSLHFDMTINKKDKNFVVNLKSFHLYGSDLSAKGIICINPKQINLKNISSFKIDNLKLTFDKKMEDVVAQTAYVKLSSSQIKLNFIKLFYNDVELSKSEVVFLSKSSVLQLYLRTNSLVNKTLKQALARYGVVLPIKQLSGENNIFAKIFIPFKDGKLQIAADVKIKDSILEVMKQTIKLNNLILTYKNKNLKGIADISKIKYNDINISNSVVAYDVNLSDKLKAKLESKNIKVGYKQKEYNIKDFEVIFENNIVNLQTQIEENIDNLSIYIKNQTNIKTRKLKGDISDIRYKNKEKNISLSSNKLHYEGSYKDGFSIKIFDNNIKISKPFLVDINNINLQFAKNIVKLNSTIKDIQHNLSLEVSSIADISKKSFNGKISNILYNNTTNNIIINTPYLLYKGEYAKLYKIDINAPITYIQGSQNISLNDIQIGLYDKIIDLKTSIKDIQHNLSTTLLSSANIETKRFAGKLLNTSYNKKQKNISVNIPFISYKGIYSNEPTLLINSKNIYINKPYKIDIDDLVIQLINNKLKFLSNIKIEDKNINLDTTISTNTNLKTKYSSGSLDIKNFRYSNMLNIKKEYIPYTLKFDNNIYFGLPTYDMVFEHMDKTKIYHVSLKNPNKLLENFTFITTSSKENDNSFVEIISEDLNNTLVTINNLNMDINSSYFTTKKEDNKSKKITLPLYPTAQLYYFDSVIKYDNITIPFDSISIETTPYKLNALLKKDKTSIKVKTEKNSIVVNSKYLTDKFINNLSSKDILEGGYIDFNVYGNDINALSGDIMIHKTKIKNVALLNTIITFINTTPAIINPLLALPTLYRVSKNGFDTNGYIVKKGSGTFRYFIPTKELNIYDFFTEGETTNFQVNSYTNFTNKKLKANIDVAFLKDFSTAIKYIPIVGYIIMGDDGEFHTSLDLDGTIDKPKIETHTVKETTRGITGMLKRIITLPVQPFLDDK